MDHEATKRFPQKTVKYVTVDIKDERNPNVFDPNGSYIHKHKQNFDVIFLPDCGGEWYPSSNDDDDRSTAASLRRVESRSGDPGI